MSEQDDILDTSRICWDGDFDAQVENILRYIRLTAEEVHHLRRLFVDLEKALDPHAPGCQVFPFGSVVTGLGIKTSDVDCYVHLPESIQPSKQSVIYARNILRRYSRIFTNIIAISAASVPIVKFLHIPTNFNCDINFKSPSGVQNSKLIGFMLHMDSRALPLAVLIKYWSKVYMFTGTNLMPNYALTLLVIFYLQQMNILPPVSELQRHVPWYMVDGWNNAFDESVSANTDNNESLYDLMGGFFKYYTKFNYDDNVISPYTGCVINRKMFLILDTVPPEFDNYRHNISTNFCKPLRIDSKICIQDPFQHNRNCAIAIFPKLAGKIHGHFLFASKKYDEESSSKFLKAVFTQDCTKVVVNKKINNVQNKPQPVFHNKVKKHPKRKKLTGNHFHQWFRDMNKKKKFNS